MPFRYEDQQNPLVGTIAALMQRRGEIAARGQEQSGQIWGNAVQNIGQSIAGTIASAADPRRKMEALQLQQAQGQVNDANALRAGQAKVDAMMTGDQLPAGDAGPRQENYLDANGLFDVPKMQRALASGGSAHLAPELLKGAESINDAITKHTALEQQAAQAKTVMFGDMADGALKLAKIGMAIPEAMDFVVQPALATKRIQPQEYAQLKAHIAQLPPEQQQAALGSFMDAASKIDKGKTIGKDSQEVDRYGRVTASNMVPDKPTEASLAADLSSPDPAVRARAETAMKALKPEKPNTAEQDDARYRDIVARGTQRQPVSAADAAWMQAYEKQKTLSVDKSAGMANDRLSRTIAQQNELQRKAQDFNVAQVARKDLTVVEKTYTEALAGAGMLRDVIDAAKGGNKVAASMQNLQAAMASVKAAGFNRINMAEIGIPGSAGSFLDRIASRFGRVSEGQPVPADLQADMVKFAWLLEKAAYRKYTEGFDSIAKYYNLTDVQKTLKMDPPVSGTVRMRAPNGQEQDVSPDQVEHYKSIGATVVK